MFSLRPFIPLLFVPAATGLVWQCWQTPLLAERLLSGGLLLFCIELAIMARVDFENIHAVTLQAEDSRLGHFYQIVFSTVVLELLGFYGAAISLQWGGVLIIVSQLWFNLLAKVQLFPGQSPAVVAFGIPERVPVLLANGVGLMLLGVWFVQSIRIWLAAGLLGLIIIFLLLKYIVLRKSTQQHHAE